MIGLPSWSDKVTGKLAALLRERSLYTFQWLSVDWSRLWKYALLACFMAARRIFLAERKACLVEFEGEVLNFCWAYLYLRCRWSRSLVHQWGEREAFFDLGEARSNADLRKFWSVIMALSMLAGSEWVAWMEDRIGPISFWIIVLYFVLSASRWLKECWGGGGRWDPWNKNKNAVWSEESASMGSCSHDERDEQSL